MGDYKIVRLNGNEWELYNMINDPTEMINLADSLPLKVRELEQIYQNTMGNSSY